MNVIFRQQFVEVAGFEQVAFADQQFGVAFLVAVVVTGDFNEPSALDWTEAAVAAGQKPVAVDWPFTRALMDAGFTDAYRAVHPDPVARPAYTWTPMYPEEAEDDHPDRIDFVMVRGAEVGDAWIVGETGPRTDLAVDPWPSDHRAVMAELRF